MFQRTAETDGKIAIDDDLVTPVFSPYSGRVTRLFARAGDRPAGDPLFAIQADRTGAGAERPDRRRRRRCGPRRRSSASPTTNEKRQHDLYLAQGARAEGLAAGQVDLATAQGGMHSAQIALAAVRNRLRILGKTDAEIAAIEAAPES